MVSEPLPESARIRRRLHELKTWPEPFQAAWEERKTYEVRRHDREFAVGDLLWLRKYEPCTCGAAAIPVCGGDRCIEAGGTYPGPEMLAEVTYMTRGGQWGLPEGLCVLGIRVLHRKVQP